MFDEEGEREGGLEVEEREEEGIESFSVEGEETISAGLGVIAASGRHTFGELNLTLVLLSDFYFVG
jgi:hypothetical protein